MSYELFRFYCLLWCVVFLLGCRQDSNNTDDDTGADNHHDTGTYTYVAGYDNRTPTEPTVTDEGGEGNVTTYGSVSDPFPSQGGACNYGETGIYSYAAISVNVSPGDDQGQWDDGRICGQCAEVWAETPGGIKKTMVRIVDKCPDAYCGIDLGGLPAQELMGIQAGRYDGGWTFIPCEGQENVSDGPTALYVKEGSNPYWAIVHIRNPPAKVLSIKWKTDAGSGVLEWATEAENYFSLPETVRSETGTVTLTITYDFDYTDSLVTTGTALTKEMALIPVS